MTAIPPVEERQIRKCTDCGFYVPECEGWAESCQINLPVFKSRDDEYYRLYKNHQFKDTYETAAINYPCKKHFTSDELSTLTDQHNAGERLIRLIELRIDDLDGQLSEGEIKKSLHDDLTCELRWILQSFDDPKQQPRQEGQ